jgi:hypothetical protein
MRYISREIQRQFARLLEEAQLNEPELDRVSDAIAHNNGTPATAFDTYLKLKGN